jgi:hypothetical protein
LNIEFYLPDTSVAEISVYTVTGQLVSAENLGTLTPGSYKRNLDISTLAGGLYIFKLKIGADQVNYPLVIYKR